MYMYCIYLFLYIHVIYLYLYWEGKGEMQNKGVGCYSESIQEMTRGEAKRVIAVTKDKG